MTKGIAKERILTEDSSVRVVAKPNREAKVCFEFHMPVAGDNVGMMLRPLDRMIQE